MKKIILILFIFLISCSPVKENVVISNQEDGYPVPTQLPTELPSGYPQPVNTPPPTIDIIPTPSSSGLVTITGYLKTSPSSPEPEVGALLYIVPVILDENGIPLVAGFSRTTDVRSLTDKNGRFVFPDIPLNKHYTLVLDRVRDSFLLKNPDNNEDIILFPETSTVLDLGELIYVELPK